MTQHSVHPAYRPDIDGLRAIAVLSVVIFHAFPGVLPGGFVGVDIFFVISGYLISTILLTGMTAGTFSIADFYGRRVKRIFPALLLVLAVCLVVAWLAFLGGLVYSDVLRLLGKHVAAASAFVANILLWTEAGYFDAASGMKPLLHLWSLGVEEQFYILWPLLLFAGWRLRFNLLALSAVVALASFALNVDAVDHHPDFAFYQPFTRMWELLGGGMLAYAFLHSPRFVRGVETSHLRRELASVAGLALLVAALVLVNEKREFPGYWALLPVVGAVLLIAAGQNAAINRLVLASRPAVFIGKISYPLYLWHWPLLSGLHILVSRSPSAGQRGLMAVLAVLLAWLTWRFVEKPVRFGGDGSRKIRLCAALMLLLLAGGMMTWQFTSFFVVTEKQKYADYFDNSDMRYARQHGLWPAYRSDCDFYDVFDHSVKKNIAPSCYTPVSAKVVVIWGDSHAQQFYHGLRETLPKDVSLLPLATSGCAPALGDVHPDELRSCNRANRFARQQIARIKPDVLVLAQHLDHEKTDWDALVQKMRALGVRHVLLLGPVPQWEPELWMVVLDEYWENTPLRIATHHKEPVFATDAALWKRYGNARNFDFLSLIGSLCNAEGCIAYTEAGRQDGLMTFDYGHLTPEGSVYVARNFITPLVQRLLATP